MKLGELRLLMAELGRVEFSINMLNQIAEEVRLSETQKQDLETLPRRRAELLAMEVCTP